MMGRGLLGVDAESAEAVGGTTCDAASDLTRAFGTESEGGRWKGGGGEVREGE